MVAISKVERLMNLVIALLATRGYLTAERIRANVAGYGDNPTVEAFFRMFERDKNELRDLGIPIETGRVSAYDPAEGYRINRQDYALPEIVLTPDEAGAIAVATQLWESREFMSTAHTALVKLRASGVAVDSDSTVAIITAASSHGVRGDENTLGILLSAIDSGQCVQFRYRTRSTSSDMSAEMSTMSTGTAATSAVSAVSTYALRTVEPWGVVTVKGRWYLVGHDRDRHDTRVFRLSRIDADVTILEARHSVQKPEGVDLRTIVTSAIATTPSGRQATLWLARGRASELSRYGTVINSRTIAGRDGDVVELDTGTTDWLARQIAGYGVDVLVLQPLSLRADVRARLTAQAGH